MEIIFVIGLIAIGFLLNYYLQQKKAANIEEDKKHPDDKLFRERYNFSVKPEQEKGVKVEKLFIYPMRGIMGIEVPHIKVSKYGIKYDREWAIYDKDKLGCIT